MAQRQVGAASTAITKLIDGQNQYIFIRYSVNSNGNPMTEKPTATTKYMGIYTSTRNQASADYRDYSWTLIKGDAGQSPVSGVLTDEFVAINTDSDGNNGDFSRAYTSIMLFQGITENTKDWTIQVTTTTGITGTYDSANATYRVTNMTVDSGEITFTAKLGESTIVKNATVQKVKAGADGQDGSDGTDGIGIKTSKIEYQISTSGETISTGTWSTIMPALEQGKFLWTKTTLTYTDNETSISYAVGFIGKDGIDGADGSDGRGIKSTTITYQAGTSGTTAPTGTWSTSIPNVPASQFLWTKTETLFTDNTKTNAYSVGKMGEQGIPGTSAKLLFLSSNSNVMKFNANNVAPTQTIKFEANLQNITGVATFAATPYIGTTAQTGITLGGSGNSRTLTNAQWNANWTSIVVTAVLGGLSDTQTIIKLQESKDGADGRGIVSTTIEYQASTSGTTTPTGTWSTTIPSVAANQYLWTRTTIKYTDNTSSISYSIGKMGSTGSAGSDGKGIKSSSVSYQASTSGTAIPTGNWLTTPPTVAANQYLWTKTTFTYTDSSLTNSYSVGRMGSNGKDGLDAIVGLVTNETISLPASNSGVVSDFSKATGSFKVYDGVTEVKTGVTFAVSTSVSATGTINSTTGTYSITALAADSGSITFSAIYKGVTLIKTVTLSKSRAGNIGAAAQLLYLTSTSEVMQFNANNAPAFAQTINISAKLQNVSGIATFSATPYINNTAQAGISLGGSGNDRTLLSTQWNANWTRVVITASIGSLSDTQTIVKIKEAKDGANGKDGTNGVAGKPGADGKTPYFHTAYSWNDDGTDRFTTEYPNENLSYKYRISPYSSTAGETVSTANFANRGQITYTRPVSPNLGFYLFNRADMKNNTTYTLSFKVQKVSGDITKALIYNGFAGLTNIQYKIDGVLIDSKLLSTQATGIPVNFADMKEHDFEVRFTTPANFTTQTVTYSGFILQIGKGESIAFTANIFEIKTEESPTRTIFTVAARDDAENAYPKYMGTYTDYTIADSNDPKKYTWSKILGDSNIIGFLTNESVTVPATSAGAVTDFSRAKGFFRVYSGLNLIDPTKITYSLASSAGGTFSINNTTGEYIMSAMSTDTATATFRAVYNGVTIEKVFTANKSKNGVNGSNGTNGQNATSYWMVLSSQVLSVPRGATALVPSNFSVVPMRQIGTAAAAAFSARIVIEESTNGTTFVQKFAGDSANYTYTPSGITVQAIRVKLYLNASSSVLLDQNTVQVVRDGSNGANGSNGTSSHTWVRYSVNANGNPMTTIPNKDTKYIGIAITSTNIAPTSYTAYTWARIKGDGGLRTRLYTNTGANVEQAPIEIFSESQSDGDIITPEHMDWFIGKESSGEFIPIGNNKKINYAMTSSSEWSNPFTNFTGIANRTIPITNITTEGWEVGQVLLVTMEFQYSNITAATGQTASCWMQGNGNITAWNNGTLNGSNRVNLSGSGSGKFQFAMKIDANHLKNDYLATQIRTDYVAAGGSIQWRKLKAEISLTGQAYSSDYSSWTPRPGSGNEYYVGNPNLWDDKNFAYSFFNASATNTSVYTELTDEGFQRVDTSKLAKINEVLTTQQKTMRIEPGKTYTQSILIKTDGSVNLTNKARFTWFGVGDDGVNAHRTHETAPPKKIGPNLYLFYDTYTPTTGIKLRVFDFYPGINIPLAGTTYIEFRASKIEESPVPTAYNVPSINNLQGVIIKDTSIIAAPIFFLEENSITFSTDVYYETMKASDQITISNKSFDAMRPLIVRQPIAPANPYPGLLWMDTSSPTNYIYRWGRSSREVPNGIRYRHYAYANQITDGFKDFTRLYPPANLIRNAVNQQDTSFWVASGLSLITTTHSYFKNSTEKLLRLQNTKNTEAFIYSNNSVRFPVKRGGKYTFGCTAFADSGVSTMDVFVLARPVGSTSAYTVANAVVSGKKLSPSKAEKFVSVTWTAPNDGKDYEAYLRIDHNGSLTNGTASSLYIGDIWFREGDLQSTAIPALPSPLDDSANAYMKFVGTYTDKTLQDVALADQYKWTTLNDASNYVDTSGVNGVQEDDYLTVYDWGWIVLTEEEKEGIPWLNNEDGSTIIDWIYQITQNTSDTSIINKVVGSEQMKDIYASSDALNELVGSNEELAAQMEEYNQIMQDYANQINALYTNITEMQQTMDAFNFNIQSAGGVNIIRNSTGFQYDDTAKTFYQWTPWFYSTSSTIKQEMGNQALNDLGFIAGFRFDGYRCTLNQEIDLPVDDTVYTLSAYMSCINQVGKQSRVIVKLINPTDESVTYARFSNENVDVPTLTKFSTSFTAPKGVTRMRLQIMLWSDDLTAAVNSTALVAGLMLNIGPYPFSWTSHHEEVYSTNVRMDGSGLKVFNSEYDGYNVITPREFAGYYKNGEQYEKVFTLNKDTTEVKKLQAEERFMMKPIQIVSIDSDISPGWAFIGYENEDNDKWNPNLLTNVTVPNINDSFFWPKVRDTPSAVWRLGNYSKPAAKVMRMTATGNAELHYRFGEHAYDNRLGVLKPGTTYTMSLDLAGNLTGGYQMHWRSETMPSSGTTWSQYIWEPITANINMATWNRVKITFTVPADAKRFYIGLQPRIVGGVFNTVPEGNYFQFKDAKLEIGSQMTL